MGKMTFCEKVLDQLSRATGGEQDAIRTELEAHLADHRDALTEKGMDPEEAMREAEEAMGDPEEIGKALNAQFSPFWLWVKWVAQGIVCVMLIFAICIWLVGNWGLATSPWDVLSDAWENWQVRQGDAWDLGFGDSPVPHEIIYSWQCWEVMRVGDELVCLTRVDLTPFYGWEGYYCGYFHFCTYNEDLFTPANGEILGQLTILPEKGTMIDPDYHWGWHSYSAHIIRGAQGRIYSGLVQEGDTYVDVTFDYFGTYATMRCPLAWEPWSMEVEP